MNNLQSFSNFAEHCGCDHSEDKKKKSKVTKEEIIKEYGDPTVSKRLRVARAIDSTFRGKPKYNSKRAKISNALKMSSIKAETRKRKAKENPYSAGKKLRAVLGINKEGYIPEEGYDHYKDRIAMAGGDPSSPKKKDATTANHTRNNETDAQRKVRMLKQQKNSARAVEMVKQRIRDKYGKNAIMDVGKKNEEVQLEKVNLRDKSTQYARSTKEVDTAMTDHVNRTKGRHYGKDGRVTEVGRYRKPSKREARNELIDLYKESYGKGRLTSTNDMQSKLYAKNNSMGRARTDDEIKKEKGGQAFLDRIKAAKSKMKSEGIKYDSKGSSMDYFLGADPKKTKEYKALKKKKTQKEGTSYGLYKGSGKPSGAMKKYLDRKAKMLTKKRDAQSDAAKNNPHFDSTQPSPSGRNKYEHVSFKNYFTEGNNTARMLHKSKTSVTGNISADRGSDEKKNQASRKGLEKDLKKKGIGYKKGVGKYKYDSGETGTEVSYQTSKPDKMSKRRFGKTMRRLGRKHGQESVITKDKSKPARLHDTESKKPGKSVNIGKSKGGSNPSGMGQTSGDKVRSGKLPNKSKKGAYHYG